VYKDDDGMVPKNATVIVKRKPAAVGLGLMTKLANSSSYFKGGTGNKASAGYARHSLIQYSYQIMLNILHVI
jgi:hypothetical protein